MTTTVFPNQLTLFENKLIRVLSIFVDAVVFTYVNDDSFPVVWPKQDFFAVLSSNKEADVKAIVDPYAYIATYHEHMTEGDLARWEENYTLIKPLLSNPDLYFKSTRNKVIEDYADKLGKKCEVNIRKQLRRFWKRGMTKNAVLPNRYYVGKRGQKKPDNGVKRGRPRKVTPGKGVNIGGKIFDLMSEACDLFLKRNESKGLGAERSDNNYKVPNAYRYFCLRFQDEFPEINEQDVPTLYSFKAYFYKKYPIEVRLRKNLGAFNYYNNFEELQSTVNYQNIGPAYRYELDATTFDVRMVSSKDRRKPVKRATLILIVDTWSRMIVGYYFGLDMSSKATTAMALKTVVSDKVKLCKKHGVEIAPHEWPCYVLSKVIATDRASEYLSKDMEKLIESYYGLIEQGPARKSRLRPVVEQTFNQLQTMIKPMCDGVVYSTRSKKAGGGNAALEARFTVDEMQEKIIKAILILNNTRTIDGYVRAADIEDHIPSKPLALWNWGIANRTGRGKVIDTQNFFCSLLPTAKVTSSAKGLNFDGFYYKPEKRNENNIGWFIRGKSVLRPKGLEVAYNKNDVTVVYLKPEKGQTDYIKCVLSSHRETYEGLSLSAAKKKRANIKLANNSENQKDALERGRFEEEFLEDSLAARQEFNELPHMPDTKRLSYMDEVTEAEKRHQNLKVHTFDEVKPNERASGEELLEKKSDGYSSDNDDLLEIM